MLRSDIYKLDKTDSKCKKADLTPCDNIAIEKIYLLKTRKALHIIFSYIFCL